MSSNFKYSLSKVYKNYQKFVPELKSTTVLRTIIQICVHYIETKSCSQEVLDRAVRKLRSAGHEVPEHFCELFAGVLQLMQLYLRYPKGIVKDDELKESLRELRYQDDCIEDIVRVLHHHRDPLSVNYREMRNLRSPPRRLVWRINVSFLDRTHSQHPTIILHIQKTDGELLSFEMNCATFHRLRFNVASLLHELQTLERRQSMKKS
ncbi:COMM domain-containing protein 5 isoform X1 [Uranotaenia lowii]|uniref:COMM domain-containing protein 5 isoform X1 n=1 Tax=Uranotaenia lowii TaxID=190385 RepID=UPI00247913EF|nr:COMM domain-containing protein 5 isoform X1 [Uranotaenia lowii]